MCENIEIDLYLLNGDIGAFMRVWQINQEAVHSAHHGVALVALVALVTHCVHTYMYVHMSSFNS